MDKSRDVFTVIKNCRPIMKKKRNKIKVPPLALYTRSMKEKNA